MWWIGLGILFFFWFIHNGDEFYEAVNLGKHKNKRLVLLQVLLVDYKSFIYD